MNIKKKTVFTAELNPTEIELITDGLHVIRSRYEKVNEEGVRIIDGLIRDFDLIRNSGVTGVSQDD